MKTSEVTISFSRWQGFNALHLSQDGRSISLRFSEGVDETPNFWESGAFVRRLADAFDQMQIDAVAPAAMVAGSGR